MRISELIVVSMLLITFTASCQSEQGNAGADNPQRTVELVNAESFTKVVQSNDVILIDVRTADEYSRGHIQDAVNVDFLETNNFKAYVAKLDKSKPLAVYCAVGGRSQKASSYLEQMGFTVYELKGGYEAWKVHTKM